jgi:acetoin utilization deacetylase AcuC-like enzyme
VTVYTLRDDHARHATPGHPERPARLEAVRRRIHADPLLAGLHRIEGAPATREQLLRVHPLAYLDALAALSARGGGMIDADTYATADSWDAATATCGDLLAVTDAVLAGDARNGFAIGRPPGHHATPDRPMGFCLLSNVALAARHAQEVYGVERVLIVDIDVHHGNGTQAVFHADPSVLFFSSHQDDIYPGSGRADDTGDGDGVGTTVNLPVPPGTADAALLDAYERLLVPLADRFRPDLVLLSAGYDAHRLDPLGGLALSVAGLADLVRLTRGIADRHADGRLVCSLEGGYHLDALGLSVASTLRVLLDADAPADDPLGPSHLPAPSLDALVEQCRAIHGL